MSLLSIFFVGRTLDGIHKKLKCIWLPTTSVSQRCSGQTLDICFNFTHSNKAAITRSKNTHLFFIFWQILSSINSGWCFNQGYFFLHYYVVQDSNSHIYWCNSNMDSVNADYDIIENGSVVDWMKNHDYSTLVPVKHLVVSAFSSAGSSKKRIPHSRILSMHI